MSADDDWVITRVNETMARLVGSDAASLVGRPFSSLLSPGSRIYHETHFAPLLHLQGEVAEVSVELVNDDGTRLPVLLHAIQSPAEPSAPDDRSIQIGVMPAPARRRFERELQEARRSADTAAERIRLLYRVIIALSGAVTPREVTAQFEQAISEVPGASAEVWLPWDTDHLIRSTSQPVGSPELLANDLQGDIAKVWRSRQTVWHEGTSVAVVPILHGGDILGVLRLDVVGMDADLGESMAAQLGQSLRRARLYEHKDWLLGMAVHDLRTPLTVVTGYAELLALHGSQRLTDKDQQMVDEIIRSGHRMSALVDDVLEMSSVESGLMVLDRTGMDLAALASRVIDDHASHAADKRIEVALEMQGDLLVLADERRLRQVFDNLISNAIKYGRVGSVARVTLRGAPDSVRIEVQDQGEGIRQEELLHVFKAFHRTSSRPTGGETSTGLGLSIARSIVEAHGGTISVASTTGVGSVFTVNLPRHTTPEAGDVHDIHPPG